MQYGSFSGRRVMRFDAMRLGLAALVAASLVAGGPSTAQPAGGAERPAFPPPQTEDQPFRLHHVTLFVRDQETVAAWYVRHLGFEIVDRAVLARQDGVRFDSVRIGMGGLWINVSRLSNLTMRDAAVTYNGWRQVSLAVRDMDAVLQRLRAAGVDIIGQGALTFEVQNSRFGAHRYRAAFIRDPEGNVVELYEDL